MAVLFILLTILILLVLLRMYQKQKNAVCDSKKRLDGKVVIVTGGTAGIGLQVATDLAKRGAKVYILCPYENEGHTAKRHIIKTTGNEDIIFKLVDLADTKTIRQFIKEYLEAENRLDLLINNAGVGAPDNRKVINGTNYIMHVNYFGHFLLTMLLLPILKKSGRADEPSRIINTSSILHWVGSVQHEAKKRNDLLYRFMCYCNSKFCLTLFCHELSKRLVGSYVVVNSLHPGLVGTDLYVSGPKIGIVLKFFFGYVFKNSWEGAQTILHVALDDEAGNVTDKYFDNCKVANMKKSAQDDKLGELLWNDSIRIVKLEPEELEKCLAS